MFTKDIEKEKSCVIYTSDYHLEMIILPYISKKLENKENIIIMAEKDINDSVKIVLSKINLSEDKKNNILKLDWNKNNSNKLKQVEQYIKQKNKLNVFVIGTEKYIDNINENLDKYIKNNIKIVNCYNFEDISDTICNIINKYNNILNTLGEENNKSLISRK